ncbi:MAG: hypothetical protein AABW81_01180 [Nanoarchaeota archaeon]
MRFFPKTGIGKISFYLAVIGLILIFVPYWIAMAFKISMPPVSGFLSVGLIIISGVTSVVSITKYKDRVIALFISALIGLFEVILVFGKFLFAH